MPPKTLTLPDDFALSLTGVRIEPLNLGHHDDLVQACQDGALWTLNYANVPSPDKMADYIMLGLNTADRIAFAVIDERIGKAIGTTSFHDILPACQRLEIGYTWYAQSVWRTHINTTCKFLLLQYAFEQLGYRTVGLRASLDNVRSQTAIERLGAKKDGIIRGHRIYKDGKISDTVMYSMTANEWQDVKPNLLSRLHHD